MKDYEKAPGLWIGSEMEDLNREMAELIAREIEGDSSVKERQRQIRQRRREILKGEI